MARVGMVVHNAAGIGTFHRALTFAEILAEQHDVHLYGFSRSRWKRQDHVQKNVNLHLAPSLFHRPYYFGVNDWLPRILEAQRADVWWCFEHLAPTFIPTFFRRKVFGRGKILVDWCDLFAGGHNSWFGIKPLVLLEKYFEESVRTFGDVNTCINHPLYERLKSLGIPENQIELIPEVTTILRPTVGRDEARQKLGIDPKKFIAFGFMERALISILADEAAEHLPESVEVCVAGPGSMDLRKNNSVKPLGYVSDEDAHFWMCAADCFLLPLEDSPANRFRTPHKFSHYCCYGKPILFSSVGDLAHHAQAGLGLVASAKPNEFLHALKLMAQLPEAERRTMGQKCQSLTKHELSRENVRALVFKSIEKVL